MSRQIQWFRVLVEGAVIVVSILLAFGIQAWWDGRQQRVAELDALRQLDGALAQFEPVLATWRSNHSGVAESAAVLLEHTVLDGAVALTEDSVATLLAPVTWGWTIDLPDPTLEAFESSGRLGALQNQELLDALTTWRGVMADLQGDEDMEDAYLYQGLTPFLNEHAAWRTIGHFDEALIPAGQRIPRSVFPSGLLELMRSRDFENLIELRRVAAATMVSNYDDALAALSEVRRLVQAEMGR